MSTQLPAVPPPAKARSIIYVDGFNWYFAIFRHHPEWKWLNVQTYFEEVRIDDEVVAVKYFTALVEPKLLASEKRSRQNLLLNALRTLPKVHVILGAYQDREVSCLAQCKQRYDVPEEKKTDVNIAVHMIDDAINGRMDRIVIVSGDSDIEPAATWIRKNHPHIKITVYLPALEEEKKVRRNDYYESIGATVKFVPLEPLEKHQLPNPVPTKSGEGAAFERPKSWVKWDGPR